MNPQFITIWLAITDATLDNGCLQVAPGSYDSLLPHCARKQTGIADGFLEEGRATPVPVKAGGAVIFSPLHLIHRCPTGLTGFGGHLTCALM